MTEWVDAAAQKPNLGQVVLVVTRDFNYAICWWDAREEWMDFERREVHNVVYWMFLPRVPAKFEDCVITNDKWITRVQMQWEKEGYDG